QEYKKISLRKILKENLSLEISYEVNSILFRFLGAYLDQGISLWPQHNINGFVNFILHLAKNSYFPLAIFINNQEIIAALNKPPLEIIYQSLSSIVSSPNLFSLYLEECLLETQGWSS